ncbi:hypothetical protein M231_07722 [Tremella mesenterica]|uniref:Palmitoyltransferase n=1 Tax=Tremella mesenterica TaxID=5217 RepID=A0A4Q1B8F1_TREME|nr:hypothetical protein M231_07722 [Tremella mesenterica]
MASIPSSLPPVVPVELSDMSANPSGVMLPPKQATVTVGRRMSLSEEASRRDSLGDTRAFYGLHSPPDAQSISGSLSRALSNHRTILGRQRSNSRASASTSRPGSPPLPISPSRSTLPLPMPKGFLSPKKPKAALRHEAREAREAQRMSELGSERAFSPISEPPPLPSASTQAHETQSEETHRQPNSRSLGGTRHAPSVTEQSTAPTTHPLRDLEESSDDLMEHPIDLPDKSSPKKPSKPHSPPRQVRQRHARRYRRYTTFENPLTTFFCAGHLMTGDDSPVSVLMVVVLLLGITGVWLGTTGVWLWQHGTEYGLAKGGGIGIVVVFISMVAAALRDPGIIPRDLDPDPPMSFTSSWGEPLAREFVVKDGQVTSRYCETCKSYRPPRSSHCRLCGNCVDGIDHHCSYIHTCVGKRNYLSFFSLLIFSAISAIYVVVFSAIHFALLCHHDHISFGRALKESPGAAVSFLLGLVVLPGVLFLVGYHLRLIIHGITTVEQLRANTSKSLFSLRNRPENPFAAKSIWQNVLNVTLARPQFPSWIDAASWEVEDTRLVNPALVNPRWGTEDV